MQRLAARPLDLAQLLQAPVDALKIRERALNRRVRGNIELGRHRDGRQRIEHIVAAGQIDRDLNGPWPARSAW
jgi:hypothetical protein